AAARHRMVLCLLYDNFDVKATDACGSGRRQANTRISWWQCSTIWQRGATRTRMREEHCPRPVGRITLAPTRLNVCRYWPSKAGRTRPRLPTRLGFSAARAAFQIEE